MKGCSDLDNVNGYQYACNTVDSTPGTQKNKRSRFVSKSLLRKTLPAEPQILQTNIIMNKKDIMKTNTNVNSPDKTWRIQKAKLKLVFPHLNDEDFQYDYGMKDVMMDHLQAKLGKTREELNEILTGL